MSIKNYIIPSKINDEHDSPGCWRAKNTMLFVGLLDKDSKIELGLNKDVELEEELKFKVFWRSLERKLSKSFY